MHIVRAVLDNISNLSQENEAVLAGASRGRWAHSRTPEFLRSDCQYGAPRSTVHLCAWNVACEAFSALRAHHDKIRLGFLRDAQNLLDGLRSRIGLSTRWKAEPLRRSIWIMQRQCNGQSCVGAWQADHAQRIARRAIPLRLTRQWFYTEWVSAVRP